MQVCPLPPVHLRAPLQRMTDPPPAAVACAADHRPGSRGGGHADRGPHPPHPLSTAVPHINKRRGPRLQSPRRDGGPGPQSDS